MTWFRICKQLQGLQNIWGVPQTLQAARLVYMCILCAVVGRGFNLSCNKAPHRSSWPRPSISQFGNSHHQLMGPIYKRTNDTERSMVVHILCSRRHFFLCFIFVDFLPVIQKHSKTKQKGGKTQEKEQNKNQADQKSKPTRAPVVHHPIVLLDHSLIDIFTHHLIVPFLIDLSSRLVLRPWGDNTVLVYPEDYKNLIFLNRLNKFKKKNRKTLVPKKMLF